MKKIKFRGKCIIDEEWCYGDVNNHDEDYSFISDQDNSFWTISDRGLMVYKKTIGQFTGLTDSDRKEVYDGDIISVNGKHHKLIKYIDDCASFCMANVNEIGLWYICPWQNITKGWWEDMRRDIKVIGSEYDNPELLERK